MCTYTVLHTDCPPWQVHLASIRLGAWTQALMQIRILAYLTELRVVLCCGAHVVFSTGQGGVVQMSGSSQMTAIYISRADVYAWVVFFRKARALSSECGFKRPLKLWLSSRGSAMRMLPLCIGDLLCFSLPYLSLNSSADANLSCMYLPRVQMVCQFEAGSECGHTSLLGMVQCTRACFPISSSIFYVWLRSRQTA